MKKSSTPISEVTKHKQSPEQKLAGQNRSKRQNNAFRFVLWVLIFGAVVFFSLAGGAFGGYQSGTISHHGTATSMAKSSLDDQFVLAAQDLDQGHYQVAYQRLEYIISKDPSYPGATDLMAETMAIIYATATPTIAPATITATPTRDLRPVEDLFQSARSLFSSQSWNEAIDTLVSLRKEDLEFNTARVDGMLFMALRMRGFDKIWKNGDLNGGIYDLALAGRFGPLDAQAHSARELARLYLIGSSFWEVDPAQAVQYFSQVAAAAPNLRDASGWTASARYSAVLVQYGDKLAANTEWCAAQEQYELALSMGADAALQETVRNAALQCSPPSATPSASPTATVLTPVETTPSPTYPVDISPTPTTGVQPTPTPTIPEIIPTDTTSPPTNTPEPPTSTPEPPSTTESVAPYPPQGAPAHAQ